MKATDAQSKLSLKDPGVQLKDEIQCQCCFCNIFIHFYSCKNQPLSISKTQLVFCASFLKVQTLKRLIR